MRRMYRYFTVEGYDKSAALSQLLIDNRIAHYIHPVDDKNIVIIVSDLYQPLYEGIYQEILKLVVSVRDEV